MNESSYNSHIGNVVVHRDGRHLRLSLVDFDISISTDHKFYTASEIKDLQEKERKYLFLNVCGDRVVSMRLIYITESGYQSHVLLRVNSWEIQDEFCRGFFVGYNRVRRYDNSVPIAMLEELIEMIRQQRILLGEPPQIPVAGISNNR